MLPRERRSRRLQRAVGEVLVWKVLDAERLRSQLTVGRPRGKLGDSEGSLGTRNNMNAWSRAYNLPSKRAAHEQVCIHSDRVTLLGNCFLVACCCSMRLSHLKSDAPIVRTRAPRPATSLTTAAQATPTSRLCGCSHIAVDKLLPLVCFPVRVVLMSLASMRTTSAHRWVHQMLGDQSGEAVHGCTFLRFLQFDLCRLYRDTSAISQQSGH